MAPRLGLLMRGGCQEPRAPRQAPACGASPAPPNLAPHKPGACRQEQKAVVAAQHSTADHCCHRHTARPALLPAARCPAYTALLSQRLWHKEWNGTHSRHRHGPRWGAKVVPTWSSPSKPTRAHPPPGLAQHRPSGSRLSRQGSPEEGALEGTFLIWQQQFKKQPSHENKPVGAC